MRMRGADTAEVSLKSETDSNGPIELGFFSVIICYKRYHKTDEKSV